MSSTCLLLSMWPVLKKYYSLESENYIHLRSNVLKEGHLMQIRIRRMLVVFSAVLLLVVEAQLFLTRTTSSSQRTPLFEMTINKGIRQTVGHTLFYTFSGISTSLYFSPSFFYSCFVVLQIWWNPDLNPWWIQKVLPFSCGFRN